MIINYKEAFMRYFLFANSILMIFSLHVISVEICADNSSGPFTLRSQEEASCDNDQQWLQKNFSSRLPFFSDRVGVVVPLEKNWWVGYAWTHEHYPNGYYLRMENKLKNKYKGQKFKYVQTENYEFAQIGAFYFMYDKNSKFLHNSQKLDSELRDLHKNEGWHNGIRQFVLYSISDR